MDEDRFSFWEPTFAATGENTVFLIIVTLCVSVLCVWQLQNVLSEEVVDYNQVVYGIILSLLFGAFALLLLFKEYT